MKKQLVAGLLCLAPLAAPLGQPADTFVNNTILVAPPQPVPQIDAINFVNNSVFIIELLFLTPYETADTLNYTNFGNLGSGTGFIFNNHNRQTLQDSAAASLYNESGAIINCAGTNIVGIFSTNVILPVIGSSGSLLRAWATNIVNRGTIEMGANGLLSLAGRNVDLSGGLLNMEGFESGFFRDAGMFDGYWGLGQNTDLVPDASFLLNSATSPQHWVTNRDYSSMQRVVSLPLATAYQNVIPQGPSNNIVQVVYLQNLSPTISNSVFFVGGNIVVQWTWTSTNIITGTVQPDFLYLFDQFMQITNVVLITNGIGPASIGFNATFIPTNYFFRRGGPLLLGTNASPGLPPGVFNTGKVTNDYTAYRALFEPFTSIPFELAGQTFSNMPGRIEIAASNHLDLTFSRIAALNYLRLTSTNNFGMDPNTRILTPVADYNLGTTNATLVVSNLLAPTLPRINGLVDLFSARWTNVSPAFITNTYHVLLVDSELNYPTPSELVTLSLRGSNVVISDVLNVLSSLTIDAYNLVVTTNSPTAPVPAGQLNFLSGNILWTNSFPRLRTLTNYGFITIANAAYFGGVRFPPFYPTSLVEPYWDFVNYGIIMDQGSFIWTTNFQNSGLMDAGLGSITLQAGSAALNAGLFRALSADITLYAGDLYINNHALDAGRKLTLWATNSLDDGGTDSGNFWTAGVGGFSLPSLPSGTATLLGTSITDTAPAYGRVNCVWAGQDLGASAAGYNNNAALGRLILDGALNSQFIFQGPTTNNAIYVDYLELRDYSTNRDTGGNLTGVLINPGMKVYYAQAVMNGVSVAEKLNGKNGGRLNWVSGYAGAFSSTNLLYPDGTMHTLNLALVTSCDLDSNNNGIVNCLDPAPVYVPSQIQLTAVRTNLPPAATLLSWQTIGYSTNYVYYKTSLASPNWLLLTNFVFGPYNGQAMVLDPMSPSNCYYRVRVDVRQP